MSDADHPVLVHETELWLVLNKPAGWHTVAPGKKRAHELAKATRGGASLCPGLDHDVETWLRSHTLFDWARELDEAGIVHRLDCETSGCLLVAKTAAEQRRLRELFQSGDRVRKIYLTIVASNRGSEISPHGELRFFFTSRHKRSKKITVRSEGDPRHEGRCSWRVIKRAVAHGPGGDLLEAELHGPGRRHQIRAGFAAIGHPILGDALYGGPDFSRGLALHAWKLTIDGVGVECIPPAWK